MERQYSIAAARQNLAAIVHELESRPAVQLTRRGEPVAVLLSMAEYQRLTQPATGFWSAYEEFRKEAKLEELGIGPDVFDNVRDPSIGRQVDFDHEIPA